MAIFGLTAQTTQTTTLSAAITTTAQSSITVASAAGFPTSGNYDILIDNEELTVTSGQGTTTWTVTRGVNNTVTTTHSNGATVRLVLNVAATSRVWYNGASFGTNIVVGGYQDTTHIADNTDAHLCTTAHVNNTKFVDSTHVSINGGGSTVLAAGTVPTTGQCGLLVTFSDVSSVATSSAIFYAYDGVTDASPMSGVSFQALEGGHSTAWVAANGSGSALSLVDQAAATSHIFYIGSSISPTSTGAKAGKIKLVLTYV